MTLVINDFIDFSWEITFKLTKSFSLKQEDLKTVVQILSLMVLFKIFFLIVFLFLTFLI
jgi:predicted membrane protein